MTFEAVANVGLVAPIREYDPEFTRLMRLVASGQMTVDAAWRQLQAAKEVSKSNEKT